jgi:hypothetical protein
MRNTLKPVIAITISAALACSIAFLIHSVRGALLGVVIGYFVFSFINNSYGAPRERLILLVVLSGILISLSTISFLGYCRLETSHQLCQRNPVILSAFPIYVLIAFTIVESLCKWFIKIRRKQI